jgi:hypothetical protein
MSSPCSSGRISNRAGGYQTTGTLSDGWMDGCSYKVYEPDVNNTHNTHDTQHVASCKRELNEIAGREEGGDAYLFNRLASHNPRFVLA